MPRMRTLDEALTEIKQTDPQTALTAFALRRMVVSGTLPSIKVGRKYLVNMSMLESYLCGQLQTDTQSNDTSGTIRRIEAR